jgi:hypothetical protein
MRSLLLWFLGVPIPIIILIALFVALTCKRITVAKPQNAMGGAAR